MLKLMPHLNKLFFFLMIWYKGGGLHEPKLTIFMPQKWGTEEKMKIKLICCRGKV